MPSMHDQVKISPTVEILHQVIATKAVDTTVVEHCVTVGTQRLQIVVCIDPVICVDVIGLNAFGYNALPALWGLRSVITRSTRSKTSSFCPFFAEMKE